ncbi:MAG: bifunctional UDP-sugar hydrolase/5'-nucleotidase [Candidatus Omnitrophota bacterium]
MLVLSTMKRLALLLLFFFFPTLTFAEIIPLTILHTNDFHSYLLPDKEGKGGADVIAAYLRQERSKPQNLLILNAGDMVSGTAVSAMYKGEPIFHVLNRWSLDAAVFGNHEFDYGILAIQRFRDIAHFPLICANAFTMAENGQMRLLADAECEIFDRGGLRIAIIGVAPEWTVAMTTKDASQDVRFVDSIAALKRLVPQFKGKVDLLVALTHVGVGHDRKIANEIPAIDLIIGGHSHTVLEKEERVNGVPIVQAGSKGLYIGRVELTVDTDKNQIADFSYCLLPVNRQLAQPDPETERLVKEWEDKVAELVDHPLGETQVPLSKMQMIYIAQDAFLEACGADYAHQNPGGTRGGLGQGAFSYREIWNIFPFDNTLTVAQVPGREIPSDFYGKAPIDPNRNYRIVTNSFVRDQWDRIHPELKHWQWEDTGFSLRDSVFRYIEKRKTIAPAQMKR